jgi:hypothetical protein
MYIQMFKCVTHFKSGFSNLPIITQDETSVAFFSCCLSVHVDNYTIIVPTKRTSLLKAQYITICTFLSLYS